MSELNSGSSRPPAPPSNWGWLVGICAAAALVVAVVSGIGHRSSISNVTPETTAGRSTPQPGPPATNR
jgi:hypothetical protein